METTITEVVNDESVRDARGRRIISEERRAEVLAEYKTSGMTQKAYAKRAGVNFHTFVSWLADERRGARPGGERAGGVAPVRFVELDAPAGIAPRASFLEVVLRDGRVARGADAGALAELVRQLER